MEVKEKILGQEVEKKNPKLVLGLIPCLNYLFVQAAWNVIREKAEQLVNEGLEEYTLLDVWKAIFYGQCHLYLAYLANEEVKDDSFEAYTLHKIQSDKPLDEFVGYILARIDNNNIHIWQLWIDSKYVNTNIMELGLNFICEQAKKIGAAYLSFSSNRKGWERVAKSFGFKETYTIYRKRLTNGV